MRNLKALGTALMAVVALGAVFASASQAASLTAPPYPASLTAEQESGQVNKFVAGGLTVECKKATFTGTITAATSTPSATPTYEECETSLGTKAPIDTNGCSYQFHVTAGSGDTFTGTVDVVCPPEKDITVTAGLCTIHIKPQTGLNGITYTNITSAEANKDDVTIDVVSNNIHAVITNVFGCPTEGPFPKTVTNAEYVSKVTVRGFNDPDTGVQRDLWID
jgi:hypothetical protein